MPFQRIVQQGNSLIVALLLSGIFPVANEEHSVAGVEVAPFDSCNFILPHSRCDRESDHTTDWDLLPTV